MTVTCLCPTYGRFSKLRESLACFLAQDYPDRRLLILNDASKPIELDTFDGMEMVTVLNWTAPIPNLGEKRQVLLMLAHTELSAHWDDDDLYLPWHLSESIVRIEKGVGMTKVRSAWVLQGGAIVGKQNQGNDATLVFRTKMALDLGGYPRKQIGQGIALLQAFQRRHCYVALNQNELLSFIRRGWPPKGGERPRGEEFARANQDFGAGQKLVPADLGELYRIVLRDTYEVLGSTSHQELERRLAPWTTSCPA